MTSITAWPPHPAQEGLLGASDQKRAANPNCTFAYRVFGPLDANRLAASYRAAAASFDALRLVLDRRVDGPMWIFSPEVRIDIRVHRRTGHTDVQNLVSMLAATQFLPEVGPLGAVHIQPCGPMEWLVTEAFTHLIADGRSLALLHDSVSAHYNGRLPDHVAGSYAELLDEAAAAPRAASIRFWHDWYNGFDPVRLPPDQTVDREVRQSLRLDSDQTARLTKAAGRSRTTLAAATLAAHAHAVARHGGTGDIATYVAADARLPDQGDVFGQVTTLVPMRITHDWSMPVAEHVQRVTRRLFEARSHLGIGIDDLDRVGAVQALGGASATVFVFQDRPTSPPDLDDLKLVAVDLLDLHQAGGLVTVAHCTADGGLSIQLRTPPASAYSRHLDSIAATVAAFLEAVCGNQTIRLGDDTLLPAEAARLISRLAEPGAPYPFEPIERPIIAALSRSNQIVLIEGGTEFRAETLNDAIRARSEALQNCGVRPGQAVLVQDATTFGRIASFLAVLQIGAVYVPIAADAPSALLEELRERSRATVSLKGGLVAVEPDSSTGTHPSEPAFPSEAAYVIFTSGSTGQPKGVLISRAALSNLAHGEAQRFDIRPGDRVLLIAPPTTDPWICHVAGALLADATLVATNIMAETPLAQQITSARVTHAFLPAAIFADLAIEDMPHLRVIASAGDRCRPLAVARYLERKDIRVFNIYGPTETTVTAAVAELVHTADQIPVGRPIRGLGARVVIDGSASAPIGVAGELMLSGIGLAIGYVDDPPGTANSFRNDPFRPGQRWYATGDRARVDPNGLIHIEGRLDRQVKIRGFRVEPGHLEAAARASLLCHDAHAIAISSPLQPDDAQLRLYVTGCDSPEGLRAALRSALPAHLIPAMIITLDQLPRNGVGKVDEAKLVAIETTPDPQELDEANPLAVAWYQVLGARPEPESDFFAVGGDSLQVLRLIRKLRAAGAFLAPADVYECRTYASLAAKLVRPMVDSGGEARSAEGVNSPLSPSQRWFLQLDLPDPKWWNQQHRIVFRQLPEIGELRNALQELLRTTPILSAEISNDGLRRRPTSPSLHLLVHTGSLDEATLADLVKRLHGDTDLTRGELLRAAAIRALDGSGILLLVAHHMVVDDWSWQLIEDRIHEVLINPSQPLSVDDGYFRFAAAIELQRSSGAFLLDAEVWRSILRAGAATDRDHRPSSLSRISAKLNGDPKALAVRWGVPLVAVLLSCFGHALAAELPGETSVVDLERNGRDALPDMDLSNVVGWVALHHPVPVRHAKISKATTVGIAELLAEIPDTGLTYGALRWSGADFGARVGRFAVNIVDVAPSSTGPAAADVVAQFDRIIVPTTNPENRLPYTGTLIFRSTGTGIFVVELTYDPDRLTDYEAAGLIQSLATALTTMPGDAHPHSVRYSTQVFNAAIPASAMQQLMMHTAALGPGTYLPRQVLAFPGLTTGHEQFIDALSDVLGQLDPFRRRFAVSSGQLVQLSGPAVPLPISRIPGGEQRALQWLEEPNEIDPVAALEGGALVALTAFVDPAGALRLGMQLHHAIMDGQSNHLLIALLEDLVRHYQDGARFDVPASLACSGRAIRKHVSAEIHAAGVTPSSPPLRPTSFAALAQPAIQFASLGADEVVQLGEWAHRHSVDLRALFGAAALALAYRHGQYQPLFLVSNGRSPDIPETMSSLGMYWYFDPLTSTTDDIVALATQVFKAAAVPISLLRARAYQSWREWSLPVGLSFNYLKARREARGNGEIHSLARRDRFHLPHQIEVLHLSDNTVSVSWLAMSNEQVHQPHLDEYLTLLHRAAIEPR